MTWILIAAALAAGPEPVGTDEVGTTEAVEATDAVETTDQAPQAPPSPDAEVTPPVAKVGVAQRYAMRQVFTSEMRDPNPFSSTGWRSTRTHTYAVVDASPREGGFDYAEATCTVQTDPVFGAETIYTDAFINAIPTRHRRAYIDGATKKFKAGPYVQSFGVELDDPMNDDLPTDKKDKRLVDTDGDGKPGATVVIFHPMVGKGHVYVAQRSVARLEGEAGDDGLIRGVVYTAPDMFKIDANRWWLRGETPQRQHADPNMSPFVMVPVGSDYDCDRIVKEKATLFPKVELPE